MEQTYLPDIFVIAIAGYCLKYIDDAGNAPNRKGTAKEAFTVEKNAGRIRTDTIPENVWLVGWLDFTKGAYTAYGHVFFIKRTGNSYQIYDSEVQSGARNPYSSIDELIAWFGAYKPTYIGWSTHCDGREYAKEKEEEMIIEIQPPVFNAQYYLDNNPDLVKNGVTLETAADHFYKYGATEGRNSAPNLHVKEYIANYKDLQKSFGEDWRAGVKHYFEYGINEGRSGTTKKPDGYKQINQPVYVKE